jgi:two-component system LytT family response regulator
MTKSPLGAVIIEDEEESLELLQNLIHANGNAMVSGSTTDPGEALDLIVKLNPDIVFLDIKMPGISGFEILDDLRKIRSVNPYIVFTTAFNEFAVKAFEYAAFDYLLKPIEFQRLNESILRCMDRQNSGIKQQTELLLGSYKKLIFRNTSGIIFVEPEEIVFIEAEGNYSVFHLVNNRTETVTMLLGKVEEQLDSNCFFRISRSFIINLSYLKKVNTRQSHCILTKNGFEFKCNISRDKVSDLVEKMKTS